MVEFGANRSKVYEQRLTSALSPGVTGYYSSRL